MKELPQKPYRLPVQAVLEGLQSDPIRGLTSAEAATRHEQYGPNELPPPPIVPAWKKFLAQFANPLTILLLVATVVSFIAWWIERDAPIPYETITILAIVLLNGILGFVQEHRAEQAVAALQAMAAANARVLRDGATQTIPTAEVVLGDVLLIEEGDTVPADARLLETIVLRVAEATLTGESVPVSKQITPIAEEVGVGDQLCMLFSGTAVASGRGRAVVTAIGADTQIGAIAGSLNTTEKEETPLQRELDRVGKLLGIAVIGIALVVGGTIFFVNHITTLADAVDVLLVAVSLAVAAVPEGLTAITTIVLSLGMQRMARRNVIVRKLAAVETLGSTTVICTDKTGTLTRNEMTVRSVVTAGGRVDFTGTGYAPEGEARQQNQPLAPDSPLHNELIRTLRAAYLANNASLSLRDDRWSIQGDPTEGALIVAARKIGLREEESDGRFPRLGEMPFSSERKLMSTAHADATDDARLVIAAKGAPDILMARCTHERVNDDTRPLTPQRRSAILAEVEQLATEALRTIGVAYRNMERSALTSQLREHHEQDLIWLGVVGMIDPPRPEALEAVRVAHQAGIRVVMITGDHPITAGAIATELAIVPPGTRAVTGAMIEAMDAPQLQQRVRESSVYARVAPEHKLRIVQALKANHEITAMTGDGVNDAPALKSSDIGVAMGITGTDVAKGAADMILTDDNFASIVAAVEEGRAIFANIRKFLLYLLSSNIGEVLVMFLGVVFAGPLGLAALGEGAAIAPLLATQILWINLLTDAAPALALGVDPQDPLQMQRPPRDPRKRVINGAMWVDIVLVGLVMAVGTLLVMDSALPAGFIPGNGTLAYAQTMAFTTLVCFQLFNVFNARAEEGSAFHGLWSNRWIWIAIGTSILLQIAVVYLPFLQRPFNTVSLSLVDWLVCFGVSSSVLWLREIVRAVAKS